MERYIMVAVSTEQETEEAMKSLDDWESCLRRREERWNDEDFDEEDEDDSDWSDGEDDGDDDGLEEDDEKE